jgi:hypothetical protein
MLQMMPSKEEQAARLVRLKRVAAQLLADRNADRDILARFTAGLEHMWSLSMRIQTTGGNDPHLLVALNATFASLDAVASDYMQQQTVNV